MDSKVTETFFEDELYEALVLGKVQVKFTKADGTERVMVCTLRPSLIPADQIPAVNEDRPIAPADLFKVFDIEKNAWRSFKPSRTSEYTKLDQ